MRTSEQRASHAAYMREYNQRPIPHQKKLESDCKYRANHLEERRAYDRKRNKEPHRSFLRYVYGRKMQLTQKKQTKEYFHQYYLAHKNEKWKSRKQRRAELGEAEWNRRQRRYWLKNRHGLTTEQYNAILVAQNGKCALCFTDRPNGRTGVFHVDHDHITGKRRGLLCMSCNHALERLERDLAWAERAVEYLKRPR